MNRFKHFQKFGLATLILVTCYFVLVTFIFTSCSLDTPAEAPRDNPNDGRNPDVVPEVLSIDFAFKEPDSADANISILTKAASEIRFARVNQTGDSFIAAYQAVTHLYQLPLVPGEYWIGCQVKALNGNVSPIYYETIRVEPTLRWTKTFGGSGEDFARSFQQTTDGGYVIVGATTTTDTASADVWLLKTDNNGVEEWNRTFGGSEWDDGYSVQQTSDGGYILCGSTNSFGSGSADIWIIKTNASGYLEWDRTYGSESWERDYGHDVQQTSDGGYIICAFARIGLKLIKTDANGIEEWSNPIGGFGDIGSTVQQTTDGGYIVCGSKNINSDDVWLVKLNKNGELVWDRTFNGGNFDDGRYALQTFDSGYIICGDAFSHGGNERDIWIIKTDASGYLEWNRTFDFAGSEYGMGIQGTLDGGYIVLGYAGDAYLLLKTNAFGYLEWDSSLNGRAEPSTSTAYHSNVRQTTDGGYVFVGTTDSQGAGGKDVWLVKTDHFGRIE